MLSVLYHQRTGPVNVIVCILLLTTTGCQQQIAGKLLGSWVGRPDTSAARAEREAVKYGKRSAESADLQHATTTKDPTDWEAYDVEVQFDFVDQKHLEMSLANGAEPMSATWRVLETTPTGCMIEVVTPAEAGEGAPVVRQFELVMDERDGTYVGFLLTESGADRQLGALYFKREEK